ncbi:uncharacterized protein K02A2.6-like [Galendromus occidentalis]|uniref:Uncharacterized protein K02A2.6-like n=1 Tax=Galendromus occidentalis TaxID=34638 RepID=A0AAJ6QQ45_9ACAR|nr:uncharacterized protein K02A2.6-like [Galendromus occidentalis]
MAKYSEEEMQEILQRAKESWSTASQSKNTASPNSRCFEYKLDSFKIPEFQFDAELDLTFKNWFERYQTIIEAENSPFGDNEDRARFIVSKLGKVEYRKFAKGIIPKKVSELSYDSLIDELTTFFDQPTSLFRRRLKLFDPKQEFTDLDDMAGQIKAQTDVSDMETCSVDEIECFIAIQRLHRPEHSLQRLRALNTLETRPGTTFDELINDLKMFENIRRDAAYVGTSQKRAVYKVQRIPQPTNANNSKYVCYRCGGNNHECDKCRFKNEICSKCKKKGHIAKVCRGGKPYSNRPRVNHVRAKANVNLIYTTVKINGVPVIMAVDTGAEVSLIDRRTYEQLGNPTLEKTTQNLTVANGSKLKSDGILQCQIELEGTSFTGKCFVTDKCSLLGLDWLRKDPHGKILNPKFLSNTITQVTESPRSTPTKSRL